MSNLNGEDIRITAEDVLEVQPHRFMVEASQIGLDHFPKQIQTNMGNGNPFMFEHGQEILVNGEIAGYRYYQKFGCITLNIYND